MKTPIKLLFIEDDELDRRAFLRMIRDKGLAYELTHAGTVADARARLAESRFDIIVADYHLPDGDCTDLFEEVKDIPFVLLTGTLEEELALRTLERGADDYLPKDVEHRHLEAVPFTVEKTLHRKHLRETEQRLTRQLHESEERLAAFMRHLPGAAWIKDREGRYVYANPEAERIFATSLEQLRGKRDEDIFPPEIARQFRENDLRVMDEEGSLETTEVLRQPDGVEHHSIVRKFALAGHGGQAAGVAGVSFDITEQLRAEEKLRESDLRYRTLFDSIDEGFCIIEMIFDEHDQPIDYRFLEINPSFEKQTGLVHAQGKRIRELAPRHKAHWFETYGRIALTGEPVRFQDWAEQLHRWYDVFAFRFGEPENRQVAVLFSDITERKRVEQTRAEQARLLDLSSDAIFVWDTRDRITYWNNGAMELYGYTREEALGKNPQNLLCTQFPEPLEQVKETLRRDGTWSGELIHRRKDGSKIVAMSRWALGRDAQGEPASILETNLDITDRKLAEEDLRAAKDSAEDAKAAAEHANRAKDHFLAVLSHELRTPLTPVVMAVSMLQDRPDFDPKVRQMLEMIRGNVELEARLIDDLLDVSRIARGKIELSRNTVPLCTVIRRAVEVCQPDIEARRLHFGVDLGPAAPYWVEADVPRLQQVFWNLLKNAIKFTPHGGCVGIRCWPNEKHVLVEVNDSGMGIEPEALPRIFNAFEQVEQSITRQFGGLGLGLAISKALVEMHGGQIEAHSEGRDKGATFRVRLPLTAPAGQPKMPTPTASPGRAVPPLHILLVEDHGITAKMMQIVLTANGHTVETAGDIATALELAGQHTFDLLVSDLGLPDGNGHDLMKQLRQRGHKFPGIALSGYGREDDIHRSYQAGFAAHLTKPASREAVMEAIASITAR